MSDSDVNVTISLSKLATSTLSRIYAISKNEDVSLELKWQAVTDELFAYERLLELAKGAETTNVGQ